jgi:hypothetical protein
MAEKYEPRCLSAVYRAPWNLDACARKIHVAENQQLFSLGDTGIHLYNPTHIIHG